MRPHETCSCSTHDSSDRNGLIDYPIRFTRVRRNIYRLKPILRPSLLAITGTRQGPYRQSPGPRTRLRVFNGVAAASCAVWLRAGPCISEWERRFRAGGAKPRLVGGRSRARECAHIDRLRARACSEIFSRVFFAGESGQKLWPLIS